MKNFVPPDEIFGPSGLNISAGEGGQEGTEEWSEGREKWQKEREERSREEVEGRRGRRVVVYRLMVFKRSQMETHLRVTSTHHQIWYVRGNQ